MSYTLINWPRFVARQEYEEVISDVVDQLSKTDGLKSVYQIGSVSSPGISDIDLLAIFDDNVRYNENPLRNLSDVGRYLFTHGINGMKYSHFEQAKRFTLYHNYVKLWGEDLFNEGHEITNDEVKTLKVQIAIEFLLENLIARSVEKKYGIFSVRNLLLSVKAIKYDLEFLGVNKGRLYDLVEKIISWRSLWFEKGVNRVEIEEWIRQFDQELLDFSNEMVSRYGFYLPKDANLNYSRHIKIDTSHEVSRSHRGLVLPAIVGRLGKKAFRIQHRFNQFRFGIPITHEPANIILKERFDFFKEVRSYNSHHLKYLSLPSCKIGH